MSRQTYRQPDPALATSEAGSAAYRFRKRGSTKQLGESFRLADSRAGSALRWRMRVLATAAVRPLMVQKSQRWMANGQPRQLHLGCGHTILPHWLNVDLVGRQRVDLALDLRKHLPFPEGSIDAVYHEHLIEHLTYHDAIALLSQCVRVLRPGGILRLGVPDFGRYLHSYAHGTDFIEAVRPGRFSPLIALAEVAYCHGHRSVWDAETLSKVLEALGLPAQQVSFGQSRLQPCPDSVNRENETLYMEGMKPA